MKRYVHHESRAHLDATAAAMRERYGEHRRMAAMAAWHTRRNQKSHESVTAQPLPRPPIQAWWRRAGKKIDSVHLEAQGDLKEANKDREARK